MIGWFAVKMIIVVKLTVWGIEDDGSVNYLLVSDRFSKQHSISFSYKEPLPIKPDKWFEMYFEGECSEMWALDPDPTERTWGFPRRAKICSADKLIILGEDDGKRYEYLSSDARTRE